MRVAVRAAVEGDHAAALDGRKFRKVEIRKVRVDRRSVCLIKSDRNFPVEAAVHHGSVQVGEFRTIIRNNDLCRTIP